MHRHDYRRGARHEQLKRDPEYARRQEHALSFKGTKKQRALDHFVAWQLAGRPADFPLDPPRGRG